MKPFDLNKALAGEPLICRDGTLATGFRYEPSDDTHGEPDPLDYAFESHGPNGKPWGFFCTKGGRTRGADSKDLFMAEVSA